MGSPEAASARLEPTAGTVEIVSLKLARGLAVMLRVSDETGTPMPGAVVTAWHGGDIGIRALPRRLRARIARASAEAATDPEGHATLAGLAKGDLSLRVTLPGFVPLWKDLKLEEADLDLGEVVLEPGLDLEGRVLDEAGQPVAGAHVSYGERPDALISGDETTATTNGNGGFVIPDLPRTGKLWLGARADGMITESAVPVTLPPDEPVELHLRPARSLEGRVVDEADGSPIAGAMVDAHKSVQHSRSGVHFGVGQSSGHATSDDDGRFVIDGLESGRFDVRASMDGYRPVRVEAMIPEQERARPVTLPLAEGLEIRGRLVDESDAPVVGVPVGCRAADSGGYVGGTASGAFTGPDGEFVHSGLAPGDYVLQAEGEGGARARAQAAAGARDVVLRLEPPGAVVVRVVDPDGDPVPGAEVAMRVASGRLTRQSDGNGEARFDAIPPATVHVSARAEGWSIGTGNAKVESGRTAETTIALSAGGVIEGTVRGLDADQLARCMVVTFGVRRSTGERRALPSRGRAAGPRGGEGVGLQRGPVAQCGSRGRGRARSRSSSTSPRG